MRKLKIAIQKNGRLNQKSLELLEDCGIKLSNGVGKLVNESTNFPIEVLYLRDDDIPQYVEQNIVDIGIIGQNVLEESQKNVDIVKSLGFSSCRLSLAVPKESSYKDIRDLNGKKIATSYPNILSDFLKKNGVKANIEFLSGSVEIAPSIGLADAICDIVSSGSTLLSNGLREVDKVMNSEAILIASSQLDSFKKEVLEKFLFRINSVQNAQSRRYILLNAPNSAIEEICQILPGMNSPTVLPLVKEEWSSLHSVINEDTFWLVIDQLKEAGAEGILVIPIEKMIN